MQAIVLNYYFLARTGCGLFYFILRGGCAGSCCIAQSLWTQRVQLNKALVQWQRQRRALFVPVVMSAFSQIELSAGSSELFNFLEPGWPRIYLGSASGGLIWIKEVRGRQIHFQQPGKVPKQRLRMLRKTQENLFQGQ